MSPRPSPPPLDLRDPLHRLVSGDPQALIQLLEDRVALPVETADRLHWELITLSGEVTPPVRVRHGDDVYDGTLMFRPLLVTGGPERTVANLAELTAAWRATVALPFTLTRHRRNIAAGLHTLTRGVHPHLDALFALLTHHTDLPVDFVAGRPVLLNPASREAHLDRFKALHAVVSRPESFRRHVEAGLQSPSEARRDLSWRLCRLPPGE